MEARHLSRKPGFSCRAASPQRDGRGPVHKLAKVIMRNQMEEFAIVGMGLGAMAYTRLETLVKELRESDVLKNDWK